MNEKKTIGEIMQCEFATAKTWLRSVIISQWILIIIASIAIITNKGSHIIVVFATFIGPLLVLLFKEIGNHYYQKGEKIRRLFLLQQGLGVEPSETELFNLYAYAADKETTEPKPIGNYYGSNYTAGFPKLVHNLQESAFWTAAQARLAMFVHYGLGSLGILISILLAIFWVYKGGGYANADHAKLFATLLLFFVAQTEIPIARSFQSLSKTANDVVTTTSYLRKKKEIDCVDVIKIISTYDSALAKALPLPGYTYKFLQEKLNNAWDAAQKKETTDTESKEKWSK